LFSIEAAPPAATREKHAKFGILDAEKLLDADLAAAAGAFGPALIFFDLDKFKDLNERFLETRVDAEILPELSQRIRDCVVGNGYAYSVGGDEFIVLLPNASSAMAQALAEAMRSVIRGRPFRCQGEEATITASFGVASAGQVSRSELRVAANEAKRLAKHGGRDRVVMYSSPTPAPLS
jgi:diguanylate cyclase (GGDEF)-like protein